MFHLTQFFQKMYNLKNDFFYYSLFRQLAYKEPRVAGCSWQHTGITLDAQGSLSFCSVASPILGNCLKESASKIYYDNLNIRNEIIQSKCNNCMHDLSGPIKFKYLIYWFLNIIKSKLPKNLIKRFFI